MINNYILDIYIFNSWNLDCDPRVSWRFFFFLQNDNPVYIYIYIYIYITGLIVTKSLYGFVSNQVQYNMESAQYQG